MVVDYIPDRGDIIWIDFNPVMGHEQGGKRPAIVLSPRSYHARSSLIIACPITTKIKGYPFEVPIKTGKINGVILADQVKTIDWRRRAISFEAKATTALQEVITKLSVLIGNP